MSHTTAIESVVITDLDALRAAVVELQKNGVRCSLVEKSTPRAYFQQQAGMGPADFVLKLDDSPYDVGLYKDEAKGGYVARTDLWGGNVARVLGAPAQQGEAPAQAAMGKLYQTYALNAATRQAARQGYKVRRQVKPDGTVQLVMTV